MSPIKVIISDCTGEEKRVRKHSNSSGTEQSAGFLHSSAHSDKVPSWLWGTMYLRGGVPGVEESVGGEMGVSVMHADRVDLFFITFDAVWRANVVSE